jgi:hypothetical protein
MRFAASGAAADISAASKIFYWAVACYVGLVIGGFYAIAQAGRFNHIAEVLDLALLIKEEKPDEIAGVNASGRDKTSR